MKKLIALFFLSLFLFNLFGYRLVVGYMQQKATGLLEASIDKNSYDDSQLIELKIPVNLPYQTTWANYQRCDGEIEIKGVLYKYVKRKLDNDTLYVMCIPNTNKMHLESVKEDFFKNSSGIAQNNTSKKSGDSKSTFKGQQSEYDQFAYRINIIAQTACLQNRWFPSACRHILSAPHISPEQPPDVNRS